jgi:predicted Rossmann fold nucleotide-binding protein DprA/Smf involved in DNA uptake
MSRRFFFVCHRDILLESIQNSATAMDHLLQIIDRNNTSFPAQLAEDLGKKAPARLWAIGSLDLLSVPKTALFCSRTCPGHAILKAMD